jgi:hypothetical protein
LILPHYNQLVKNLFAPYRFDLVYHPGCQLLPYDRNCWTISYPDVSWNSHSVVVMHCQDFLTIKNGTCPELLEIENYFGDHAYSVVVLHWNLEISQVYSGPLTCMYFPTHSYELMQNLKDFVIGAPKNSTVDYQCLNGLPKQHRQNVVKWLQENTHVEKNILSLGSVIPLSNKLNYNHYSCDNVQNWLLLNEIYKNCKINIVTETEYSEDYGIISEKTLFAFLGKQIPIVIGHRNIVRQCEELGFDMFTDIVDTSYDNQPPSTRWKSALDSNKSLVCGGYTPNLEHRLEKNRMLALNLPGVFADKLASQIKDFATMRVSLDTV